MKSKTLLISAICLAPFFAKVNTGEDVVKFMYKKYAGKWACTLVFEPSGPLFYSLSSRMAKKTHLNFLS